MKLARPTSCEASVPIIGVLRESGTLDSHDAEALAGGCLQHYPTLQSIHHLRAELLEARDLSRDVVGFNIDVHPTFVLHALDLYDGLVRRCLQHAVVAAGARGIRVYRAAQCPAPEVGG